MDFIVLFKGTTAIIRDDTISSGTAVTYNVPSNISNGNYCMVVSLSSAVINGAGLNNVTLISESTSKTERIYKVVDTSNAYIKITCSGNCKAIWFN